jgi:hypothetical protein
MNTTLLDLLGFYLLWTWLAPRTPFMYLPKGKPELVRCTECVVVMYYVIDCRSQFGHLVFNGHASGYLPSG